MSDGDGDFIGGMHQIQRSVMTAMMGPNAFAAPCPATAARHCPSSSS